MDAPRPQSFTDQVQELFKRQRAALGTPRASGFPVSGEHAASDLSPAEPTQPACGAEPHPLNAPPPGTSLEQSETSEKASPVQEFLSRKPESVDLSVVLEEQSWSVRYRHSGWAPIRRRVFDGLKRVGVTSSRLSSFSTCGLNSWVERSAIDSTRFRLKCGHCHDRLCTPCANQRSFRIQEALMSQFPIDGALFITLTLCGRNESLVELVDRLYRSFKALRNHPTWEERIQGGAAFLEIKWSDRAQRWHPHLHIIAAGRFMPQQDLCDAWRSITKDSYIVDIRRIRDKVHASRYVCKYASKPLNGSFSNTPRLLDEAILALKGRRLCLCFGTWYGTPLQLAEDETLADDEVDAGEWTSWLPWETVLQHAASGDADSIELIRSLGVEAKWRQSLTPGP